MQHQRHVNSMSPKDDRKVISSVRSLRLFKLVIIVLTAILLGGMYNACAGDPTLTQDKKKEIIDSVSTRLLNEYVFPDTARNMVEKIKSEESQGNYDKINSLEDFLGQLQQDLQSVYADQHLGIRLISEHGSPPSLEDEIPAEQMAFWNEFFRFENYGIRAATRLDGNVGYIDFRFWPDSALVTDRILSLMSLLRGVDALIIDVRYHMGGRIEPARLVLSHLFEKPVNFVTSINRVKNTHFEEWTTTIKEKGTLSTIPIWVLTGNETASGGELLPFVLKNLDRATIVGAKTRGAGLRTHQATVPNLGFEMYISHAADVNPVTGVGWEGTGVQPDIEIPASEALAWAHMEALKHLTENNKSMLPNVNAERDWALGGFKAELNDQHPSIEELDKYTGTYDTRRIWVENGSLHYQRDDKSDRLRLSHMYDHWFMFDSGDLYYVRISFEVDDSGEVKNLSMNYDNGQKSTYDRN